MCAFRQLPSGIRPGFYRHGGFATADLFRQLGLTVAARGGCKLFNIGHQTQLLNSIEFVCRKQILLLYTCQVAVFPNLGHQFDDFRYIIFLSRLGKWDTLGCFDFLQPPNVTTLDFGAVGPSAWKLHEHVSKINGSSVQSQIVNISTLWNRYIFVFNDT